jgi:hypothetical protein
MNPQNEIRRSHSKPARSGRTPRAPQTTARRHCWFRFVVPVWALAILVMQSGRAWGQLPGSLLMPAPAPPAAVSTDSTGNEAPYLKGLPNTPDVPSSLYAPATPTYTCSVPECPYFDCDPRLDPFCLPQPGWVADIEVDVNLPHVSNGVHDAVTLGGVTSQVALGSARLDWTASPRLELGYRLPDGFGEFDISFRYLGSQGAGTVFGPGAAPDGPATLTSRLDMGVADLQYASNEISICTWWTKWHFGFRGTDIFFDSKADENPAVAAGGSGIFERRMKNSYWGIGPCAGLDLERRIGDSGFTVLGRVDGAIFLGRVEQAFFEVGTTGASAEIQRSNPGAVPTLNWSLGLAWRPPSCQALRCFIGYQGEGLWDVGAFEGTSPGSNATIYTEGVLFRVDYNY